MNARRMGVCLVLSGLVMLPFGCGKQETGQVRDKQEKVAIEGAKAKPRQEAVAADKLQNRAGVIYIVNGQKPFSGMAQDFYANGQMKWEAGITDGVITALKRWHQNGVLELQCGFTGGTLDIIQTDAQELLQDHVAILDGEFTAFLDNGQKCVLAKFNRGQLSGDLEQLMGNGLMRKTSFTNGKLTASEEYYPSGQMAKKYVIENGNVVGDPREWTPSGMEIKARVVEGLGLKMLRVEPGTFTMGSPASESGRDSNEVQHAATITKEYWLGKYEVTQGEWSAVMGSAPSNFKGNNRLPVEQVSWDDAMAFCQKLTETERNAGRLPEGYAYTLPTEAQWEYACRAGSTEAYAGDLDAMAWYSSNSGSETHPAGSKQANAWGFHDMHGNVWEWCSDWYGDYGAGSITDPTGPSNGSNRVYRGGGWCYDASYCRSADRLRFFPGFRFNNLGFRLCLAPVR